MKISATISQVESRLSDRMDTWNMGRNAIIPPSIFIVSFFSPDAKISLEITERSKLYEDLALFSTLKGKGAQFIFDIGGDLVDDYFKDKIQKLNEAIMKGIQKNDSLEKRFVSSEIIKDKYKVELDTIKSKWWYKLFNSL